VTDAHIADGNVLVLDPYVAGVVELERAEERTITETVLDALEFGDKLCFRLSFGVGPQVAAVMGRFVEEKMFADFCALKAPCTSSDFFDRAPSAGPYIDFLKAQHPNIDPAKIEDLRNRKRPDMLRNRPTQPEWYELKPMSISGAIAGRIKAHVIPINYAIAGLPYKPGTSYNPTEFIPIGNPLIGEAGEKLDIVLHLMRRLPGLVFWEICVKGDYVEYFNRVRLAAGILAILVAIGVIALPAAEAAAIAAAVAEAAAALGAVLPVLVPR
jgi:hypothetical protein